MRKILLLLVAGAFMVSGCASSEFKRRKAERDKVSQSSGLYCDFVNGEIHPDVEVELNLEMAKRCDSTKPFSLSNYKTQSENAGVVYCCSMKAGAEAATPAAAPEKSK